MIRYKKHGLKCINFNIRTEEKRCGRGYRYVDYCDDIITFDIETTSAWIDPERGIIPYEVGHSDDYWNSLESLALCYLWQCSINDIVFYGRELTEFINFLNELPQNCNIIIWVHNLSWEWHFLCNILEWDNIFARSPHKPMKAVPVGYPKIEFRCSYTLTNLRLEKWGEQVGVNKLVGYLDYEQLRTPLTELDADAMSYASRDCEVVYAGILDHLKRYENQWDIPLTSTGKVRRVAKERLIEADDKYIKKMKKLIPKDADDLNRQIRVFAGGYTHANRRYAGKVIDSKYYGPIKHKDFKSSYPRWMIDGRYPSTAWSFRLHYDEFPSDEDMDRNAYMLEVKFIGLKSTTFNTYIPGSRSRYKNVKLDNGRVISADELIILITELDWLIIRRCYEWDDIELINSWYSVKDYLPLAYREYVLELFYNKEMLKHKDPEIYTLSKTYINALFGMCCTGVVQSDITYIDGKWDCELLTKEVVNEKLKSLKKWYPGENRYFLNYTWHWITAYSRKALWDCILSCDEDVLYCDTDSIFYIGDHDFNWWDKQTAYSLKKSCDETGLDYKKCYPSGPNEHLGYFMAEDDIDQFITLGAKRYCLRNHNTDKLELTISGINKSAVAMLNDDIHNFKDGFVFDKDNEHVTKKLHKYIDDQRPITWPDGYKSYDRYGINLRRCGYTLGVPDAYKMLIDYSDIPIDEIPPNVIQQIRKVII